MKKYGAILLTVVAAQIVFAGYFDDKGWVSGLKFAPLQVDVSLINDRRLVDESSNTALALGLFILEQKSAIVSMAFVANTLQSNYGVQFTPFPIGVVTDKNYGISLGVENYCKNCYGIQLGLLNHIWAGTNIDKRNELLQILGINIADTLYIGAVNISEKVQIGLLNIGKRKSIFQIGLFNGGNTCFQIGLLNHNPRSYIPWLPLVNWDMGREEK